MRKVASSEKKMLEVAKQYAGTLKAGTVIFLHGNLGAGKTTFVKGILRALGYEGNVKSPTYTLVESYELEGFSLHHFDLYRLADPEELEWIGVRDYFNDSSICFIEWPEKGNGFLSKSDKNIYIKYLDKGRELKFL